MNNELFASGRARTVNLAGGAAFGRSTQDALTQFAVTGSFMGTCYMSPRSELDTLLGLAAGVDSEYIAKLAIYSRENGFRKDVPAAWGAGMVDGMVGAVNGVELEAAACQA